MPPKKSTLVPLITSALFAGAFSLSAQTTSLLSYNADRLLSYTADAQGNKIPDYSAVGYRNGEYNLPLVDTVTTLSPVAGDDASQIQTAINNLAAQPLVNGFRGAIYLSPGTYDIGSTINITAAGIVLRGAGPSTILRFTKRTTSDQINLATCIKVDGGGLTYNDASAKRIQGSYVPFGSKTVTVASGHSFAVNDWVALHYQFNTAFVDTLRMDLPYMWDAGAGAGNEDESWPTDCEYRALRKVVAVSGNVITLDAPLMDPVDTQYGVVDMIEVASDTRITHVGVECLRIESAYLDETEINHGWKAIAFEDVKDGWVREVDAYYFIYSCVSLGDTAHFITVDNCSMNSPKGAYASGRRYSFNNDGQRNLFQNCLSTDGGRHNYVSGSWTPGPSVFYNCVATGSLSDAGPHHRWTSGHLYDNVSDDYSIRVRNRGISGSGHGWTGSQIMLWNCESPDTIVQDQPGPWRNWAIGCTNVSAGDDAIPGTNPVQYEAQGVVQSEGTKIAAIPSLYLAQLNERLGGLQPVTEKWTHNGPTTFTGTNSIDGGTSNGSGSQLTVAFFANASVLKNSSVVDKLPLTGTSGWSLKLRSNGDLWFRIGSEASGSRQDVIATGVYSANTRVHIATTFKNGTATIYKNGVQTATMSGITAYNVANTTTNLRLGVPSVAATTNTYEGTLEQVKVYDTALTAAEIADLAGWVNPNWTHNGPTTFTGSNSVSGTTSSGGQSNLTVAFWATPHELASMSVVDKLPLTGTAGWSVKFRSNGDIWFRVGSEASGSRTDVIATDCYAAYLPVHVACTFTGGTAKIYIDGVLRQTTTGIPQTVNNTTTTLRLGIPSVAATTNVYKGVLSGVKIYDSALSDAQIAVLANQP